jgi:hypothetical protein
MSLIGLRRSPYSQLLKHFTVQRGLAVRGWERLPSTLKSRFDYPAPVKLTAIGESLVSPSYQYQQTYETDTRTPRPDIRTQPIQIINERDDFAQGLGSYRGAR